MSRIIATAALAVLMVGPAALAQPGAGDVSVKWDSGFPKVAGGKLKVQGTVTFANGWSSVNGKVTITVAPTKGGTANIYLATITNGAWALDIPLPTGDVPVSYDITPSVLATNDNGATTHIVTGPRETRNLP